MPTNRPYKLFCMCNSDWPLDEFRRTADVQCNRDFSMIAICKRCGFSTWYFTKQGAYAKFQRALSLMYAEMPLIKQYLDRRRAKNNGPLEPDIDPTIDRAKIGK